MGEREGRLAWHEDQLATFLEVNFGGTLDQIAGSAVRDSAERSAARRADHHAIGEERPAGHGGEEILVVVIAQSACTIVRRTLACAAGLYCGVADPQAAFVEPIEIDVKLKLLAHHVPARRADRQVHIASGGA